jgi:hypothetical protein
MKTVLFYGNCQATAVLFTLNLPKTSYIVHNIPCWTTDQNKDSFTAIIKNCDIIITQPINDNYRDVDYLSTSYIINNSKKDCKIIIFDSCHFDFYYFDLTYKYINGTILQKPIDYHYNEMINCYHNNVSIDNYINNYINNEHLKTSEELDTIAQNSLNELKRRFYENVKKYASNNIILISTYEFIKNNYKDKLLFYSMNHPTKHVIRYICKIIIHILKIENTIDYKIDMLENNTRCILYKCIQKNVNFDITLETPLLDNETDLKKIINKYYDSYKETNLC